jgi:hypothetical protein
MIRRFHLIAVCVLATASLGTVSCGSGSGSAKLANVKVGEMPSGAEWSAEYFSEDIGTIELVAKGDEAHGKWQRPHKDKWAEFKGTVDGNVLKFDYTEYNLACVGPNCQVTGKGVMVYTRPAGENVDDVLNCSIGRKQDEVGYDFTAKKQRNVAVDIDKIGGTAASDIVGGDWDKNSEHGKPEGPAHPND